nr:RNA-directed DNA polymerase, eukaryota, reverse transcriptase zinc-binding domain protein [Tanacetum cinerariifolium]
LVPNMDKSIVFVGSVKEEDKRKILDILPFVVGKLPMKYLGVPLITKKLGYIDNKQLIDKVKGRIEDWKNKYLSYAGRLQLTASVLASLNVYWVGVFLIPKAVVKDIDKRGNILFGSNGSMWLNLKGRTYRKFKKNTMIVGCRKHLLDLRVKARKHIFKVLGDGKDTNFWHDQWSTKGVISDIVSNKDRNDARLADNMSVWEMISNNKWRWPNEWERKYRVLTKAKVPILNN